MDGSEIEINAFSLRNWCKKEQTFNSLLQVIFSFWRRIFIIYFFYLFFVQQKDGQIKQLLKKLKNSRLQLFVEMVLRLQVELDLHVFLRKKMLVIFFSILFSFLFFFFFLKVSFSYFFSNQWNCNFSGCGWSNSRNFSFDKQKQKRNAIKAFLHSIWLYLSVWQYFFWKRSSWSIMKHNIFFAAKNTSVGFSLELIKIGNIDIFHLIFSIQFSFLLLVDDERFAKNKLSKLNFDAYHNEIFWFKLHSHFFFNSNLFF